MTAEELTPLLGLALSVGLAYACTPIAIRAAHRFEFYDHPVGYKGHAQPTPYLGGAAVVAAFIVVLLLLGTDSSRAFPLLAGVGILWAVGTIDDRRTVSPSLRVALEAGLAAGLWAMGYGWDFGLGAGFDLLLTVLWIVGVVNAFNLFDNMDGAAGSMAAVAAGAIAVVGVVTGDQWLAVASAALAGACLGFLPYNLASPAKIFLGDGGSMPAGFGVAALAMMGASGAAPSWQALAIGVLIVGIPALDTALVVVSRLRRQIPVATAGRDHLTHRTRQRLQTVRAVVIALGAAQVVLAVLAVLAARGGSDLLLGAMFVYLVGVSATLFVLDGRPGAPLRREGDTLALPERTRWRTDARVTAPRTAGADDRRIGPVVLLALVGLLAGLSPFVQGLYRSTDWAPVGIAVVVACVAALMASPFRPPRRTIVLVGAVAALGLFTLLSASWAPSTERAVADADRIFLYAALLVLLLVLVRNDRAALFAMAGVLVGGLVVSIYLAAELVGGDGAHLFLGGRLDEPLNYINGQGTALLLTFFPALALAEQRRYPALAGVGASAATLVAGLALQTESRGTALAALVGLLALVVLVPGRMWRLAALAPIAVAFGIAAPRLLDVSDGSGIAAQGATWLLLVVSIVAGFVWWSTVFAAARATPRMRERAAAGWKLTVGLFVALITAVTLVNASDVVNGVDDQYHAFVRLEGSGDDSTTRLLSGGGTRYDYWRIAVEAWEDEPIAGLGAGGYQVPYFRERSTTENIRQPHSLGLQTLAELGLVGLSLLLIAAVAIATAVRAQLRSVGDGWKRHTLIVAALGSTVAWGTHSSVDWPHLLPGVTAVALISIAVLFRLGGAAAKADAVPRSTFRRAVPAVATAAFLALAGFSLSRQVLVDHYRSQAEDALSEDRPEEALEQAAKALRLAPDDIDSYFVRAAAHARFNEPDAARAALEDAIQHEPSNFVARAFLGDLEVRLGDYTAAGRAYRAASALNPRDPELAKLAAEPRRARKRLQP